jgi:glyoxylase I family protein
MRGWLHHVDLTVTDAVISRPLYDLFLGHAGYVVVDDKGARGADWGLHGKTYPSIGIRSTSGDGAGQRHNRYAPGLHHLALYADSREDVDALYEKLVAFRATILDAPADYPEYGPGYYAVFFADPDGLKLEYVFTPPSA